MAEQARTQPAVSEGALWLGLLGGPLAWLAQLGVSYPLVPPSCAAGWGAAFHMVSLAAALVAAASGAVAWQSWRRLRGGPEARGARLQRQGFMALGGALASALFLATIVAQWLPVLFLSPCEYR